MFNVKKIHTKIKLYWIAILLFIFGFSLTIISCSSEDDAALKDGKLATDISEADQFNAPTGSVLINNGDTTTSSSQVTLRLSASDAGMIKGYYVSEKNAVPSTNKNGWVTIQETQNYSATIDHTISGASTTGNHQRTIYAWFKDTAENVSTVASDSITLVVADTKAPSSVSVIVNDNSSSTSNTVVTLSLSAKDDYGVIAYYASEINNTPSNSASGWNRVRNTSRYSDNVSFTLASEGSAGNHSRSVYVWFKDDAGNVSTPVSDGITLVVTDITAPASPSININSSADNTNSIDVILSISAADAEGVTGYYAKESNTAPASNAAEWDSVNSSANYSDNVSFTLTSASSIGNHSRTVYIWYKDQAGNVSSSASDSINLVINESTPPANPSISINSGSDNTTSYNVTLNISATDNAGVAGYLASETSTTPTANDSRWESLSSTTSYSDSVSFELSFGNRVTKTIYVWFRDAVGNISSVASDSILTNIATIQKGDLEWQYLSPEREYTYPEANNYCRELYLNDYPDWRLPTTSEINQLSEGQDSYPHTIAELRDVTEIGLYWYYNGDATISSAWDTSSAWFRYENFYCCSPDNHVRCVRGLKWPGVVQLGSSTYGSNERGNGIVNDSSGNIYIAGYTQGGLQGNTHHGSDDIFLIKYSSIGKKIWARQIGTSSGEQALGIAIDISNDIYLTGYTLGGLDGNTSSGSADIFLVKYNSSGVKQWTKLLGTVNSDIGNGLAVDNSSNVYVTGVTNGELDGNSNSGSEDIFLVKFNSSGTKQWTKQFGTSDSDQGYAVTVDSSGYIYVTGMASGALDNASSTAGPFIVKYDSSGNRQWTKQFGPGVGAGITSDSSNNIFVTGWTTGSLESGIINNYSKADLFLAKYNSSGTQQWIKQIGSHISDSNGSMYPDGGYGVEVDSSNNIYVTGYTTGPVYSNNNYQNSDIFLIVFGTSGSKILEKSLGAPRRGGWGEYPDGDVARGITIDSSGGIYVTGHTKSELKVDDFKSSIYSGGEDIFVLKYSSSGVLQ